jgi:hypothetical protein
MKSLQEAWASANFERLRAAHRQRTWDDPFAGEAICKDCAVTKVPTRIAAPLRLELPVRR